MDSNRFRARSDKNVGRLSDTLLKKKTTFLNRFDPIIIRFDYTFLAVQQNLRSFGQIIRVHLKC